MKHFRVNDKANEELCKELKRRIVSDRIIFRSKNEADDFHMLIKVDDGDKEDCLPADILIAGTIPLYDCSIIVKNMFQGERKDLEYRVFIDPNCDNIIDEGNKKQEFSLNCVGCIVLKVGNDDNVVFPICVMQNRSVLCLYWTYGYYSENNNVLEYEDLCDEAFDNYMEIARNYCMPLWYKVQIALLHPVVKDVLSISGTDVIETHKPQRKGGKTCKRTIKYIKRRIINLNSLQIDAKHKDFVRKTLAWYVIGHYREYKDGKRIFVKPYWKGEMRELKRAVEQRERKIITEGINND